MSLISIERLIIVVDTPEIIIQWFTNFIIIPVVDRLQTLDIEPLGLVIGHNFVLEIYAIKMLNNLVLIPIVDVLLVLSKIAISGCHEVNQEKDQT